MKDFRSEEAREKAIRDNADSAIIPIRFLVEVEEVQEAYERLSELGDVALLPFGIRNE